MTASPPAPRLSVVVLAYDEEPSVRAAVTEIVDELERLGVTWECIVVDDGSHDATGAIADELAATEPRLRVVHHGANLGLGGGYRTGFREARGEWLTFFPADRQFAPAIIGRFLERAKGADLVVGYAPRRRDGVVGAALSVAERMLYRLLLGDLPRYQGIVLIRRTLLAEIELVSQGRGWTVIMELLIRASRGPYRLVSAPNEIRPRTSGQSKVNNLRTIVANLRQLWELSRTI